MKATFGATGSTTAASSRFFARRWWEMAVGAQLHLCSTWNGSRCENRTFLMRSHLGIRHRTQHLERCTICARFSNKAQPAKKARNCNHNQWIDLGEDKDQSADSGEKIRAPVLISRPAHYVTTG